ncbi:TonB-dependent receptor [Sphingoaurantiacus capsulatus]|uniref:TonB-dependent receptor n=1 Tax=Sphingoaurantiacus capsulatus TaxID=1771310 RepID=A0ABV7XCD6_9SPHN
MLFIAFLGGSAAQVLAQAEGEEEIIVTAQRRGESIQDIPIAITALSGDLVEERGYSNLADLDGVVPSLNISTYSGNTRINIRGIGNTNTSQASDASVALYKNGVYIGRSIEGGSSFLDMERIEILRGPQGDLYGRNATGGAVSIISKRPTDRLEGEIELGVGSDEQRRAEAILNAPLSDKVGTRFVFAAEKRGGFGTNLATGTEIDTLDTLAGRGTIEFNPSDTFQLTVIGDYYRARDRSGPFVYLGNGLNNVRPPVLAGGVTVPTRIVNGLETAINPRNISNEQDPFNEQDLAAATIEAKFSLSDSIELTSVTGYRDTSYFFKSELDASTALYRTDLPGLNGFTQEESAEQISQELTLVGDSSGFEWLLGASYFDENVDSEGSIGLAPAITGLRAGARQDIRSYALFGRVAVQILPELRATAGLRWSSEKRRAVEYADRILLGVPEGTLVFPPLCGGLCLKDQTDKTSAVTPRFTLEYSPTDQAMIYLQAARGFRSGGFSMGQFSPAYDPEFVWSYEAGVKYTSLDRAFRLNLAAFHYDYSNLQITSTRGGFVRTANAADSTVNGLEVETVLAPTDGLNFDIAYAYLDAQYDELIAVDNITNVSRNLSGNVLPNTSKHAVTAGINLDIPLEAGQVKARGEMRYKDDVFLDFYNRPVQEQEAYTQINASIGFTTKDERWSFDVYGRNLTDKLIVTTTFLSTGTGFPRNALLAPPRTFGVRVRYRFG